jgi:hypothetical protein
VPGISADPQTGFKTGYVTLDSWPADAMTGDYFRVDPTNNFASGDELVNPERSPCLHWDSRFFNGGVFSGGTTFTFLVRGNSTGGISPVAVGQVYDDRNASGTVQIYTADNAFRSTRRRSRERPEDLRLDRVTIYNPYQQGFVLATYRASGKSASACRRRAE